MAQAFFLAFYACFSADAEDIAPALAPFIVQPLGLTAIREDECLSDPSGVCRHPRLTTNVRIEKWTLFLLACLSRRFYRSSRRLEEVRKAHGQDSSQQAEITAATQVYRPGLFFPHELGLHKHVQIVRMGTQSLCPCGSISRPVSTSTRRYSVVGSAWAMWTALFSPICTSRRRAL